MVLNGCIQKNKCQYIVLPHVGYMDFLFLILIEGSIIRSIQDHNMNFGWKPTFHFVGKHPNLTALSLSPSFPHSFSHLTSFVGSTSLAHSVPFDRHLQSRLGISHLGTRATILGTHYSDDLSLVFSCGNFAKIYFLKIYPRVWYTIHNVNM